MRIHGIGFAFGPSPAVAGRASAYFQSLVSSGLSRASWRSFFGRETHAGTDGRETRIGGFVSAVVAVEAVHAKRLHVNRVRKLDGLLWRSVLRGGGAAVRGNHDGTGGQEDEAWNRGPLPSLDHQE